MSGTPVRHFSEIPTLSERMLNKTKVLTPRLYYAKVEATMPPTPTTQHNDRIDHFKREASRLSEVNVTTVDQQRYPPRIYLDVAGSEVPAGLHDLLDEHNAVIQDVMTPNVDELRIQVQVNGRWKDAGVRTIRDHSGASVLNIPPEALDGSQLGLEEVDVHARPGELHIRDHDADVPLPN